MRAAPRASASHQFKEKHVIIAVLFMVGGPKLRAQQLVGEWLHRSQLRCHAGAQQHSTRSAASPCHMPVAAMFTSCPGCLLTCASKGTRPRALTKTPHWLGSDELPHVRRPIAFAEVSSSCFVSKKVILSCFCGFRSTSHEAISARQEAGQSHWYSLSLFVLLAYPLLAPRGTTFKPQLLAGSWVAEDGQELASISLFSFQPRCGCAFSSFGLSAVCQPQAGWLIARGGAPGQAHAPQIPFNIHGNDPRAQELRRDWAAQPASASLLVRSCLTRASCPTVPLVQVKYTVSIPHLYLTQPQGLS